MPLKEYPDENVVIDGEKVRLELSSEQYDLIDSDLFNLASVTPVTDNDGKKNSITFKSEGILKEQNDLIKLSYTENAKTEMDGTVTSLTFDKKNPKSVFIERKGAVTTAFYIEEGVKHTSNYSTPFGNADIATLASRVTFEERGKLAMAKLDYIVELRGMTAQRTRMTIKIVRK